MNGDLISREDTLTAFADYVGSGMSMNDYDALYDIVLKMPPKDQSVQDFVDKCRECGKQKTGHWIRITNGAMKEKYICSECGRQIEDDGIEGLLSIKYPYCHCGAKMESEG